MSNHIDGDPTTLNWYDEICDQMRDHVLAGRSDKFQLLLPFEDWTWQKPPDGFIDKEMYQFVGYVPKYSAIGKYEHTGVTLVSAYRNMLLTCVNPVTVQNAKNYKQAQQHLANARNTRSRHESEKRAAWTAYSHQVQTGMPPTDYKEWYKVNWEDIEKADAELLAKAIEAVRAVNAQTDSKMYKALQVTERPADYLNLKAGWVACHDGGHEPSVRPNFHVPYPQDWLDELTTDVGRKGMTIELSIAGLTRSKSSSQSPQANTSYSKFPFFQLHTTSGSWQTFDLTKEDPNIIVTIDIAIAQFDVSPDSNWYNGKYLEELAVKNDWNHPFIIYHSKEGDKAVFGHKGILECVMTGIIVGYQPTFAIRMSSSTFTKYRRLFEEASGISVGPFLFGAGFGHSTEIIDKKATDNTFSGKSAAKYPIVMGITVAVPGS